MGLFTSPGPARAPTKNPVKATLPPPPRSPGRTAAQQVSLVRECPLQVQEGSIARARGHTIPRWPRLSRLLGRRPTPFPSKFPRLGDVRDVRAPSKPRARAYREAEGGTSREAPSTVSIACEAGSAWEFGWPRQAPSGFPA